MNYTPFPRSLIETQFEYAKTQGWIPFFEATAALYAIKPELLMGIASRETEMGTYAPYLKFGKTGDNGHGRGLMQIDDRSWGPWINTGQWVNEDKNIDFAANLLEGDLKTLVARTGKTADEMLPYAVAAYNCGAGNAHKAYVQGDGPDKFTAGGNYSLDVLARAVVFAELLSNEASPK